MIRRPRTEFGLNMLIILGVILASTGVVLHFALPHKYDTIELLPIIVGFTMAYFGALWKDPDRAARAGHTIAHVGAELVESARVWRGGSRKGDPVVEVTKRTNLEDPEAEPQVEVTVKHVGDLAPGALPEPEPPAPPAVKPVDGAPGAYVPGEGP